MKYVIIVENCLKGTLSLVIHYPNGKPYRKNTVKKLKTGQPTVKYSNRGMTLEEDINLTNKYYLERNIAVVHKKPTPVQIVHVDYPKRSAAKITEAYFKTPSTTDYNGLYRGKYLDFEAKETRQKTAFPLKNFHEHQIVHMQQVLDHGGICFIIMKFTSDDAAYLLDASHLLKYWVQQQEGGRKSITKSELDKHAHIISQGLMPRIDYIRIIDLLYF